MNRIIVIADDLTGAAEMAGIGLRFGHASRLVVNRDAPAGPNATLTVINADTRLLPEAEAIRIVSDLAARIDDRALLFKKIDSVVRGHVAAEINAVLGVASRFDRTLLLPQNPSRLRVVRSDGTYLVDNVPLAKTTFASDPDHPARSSQIMDRLRRTTVPATLVTNPDLGLEAGVISVAAAETFETVRAWARQVTPTTFLVGAADLFTATLERMGHQPAGVLTPTPVRGRRLYLCGSTSTSPRRLLRSFATSNGIEVSPDESAARVSLQRRGIAVVMSPEPGGVELDPRDVEVNLGQIGKSLINAGLCDWVFAEGGATATAVCAAMGWKALGVESELASGVVVLRPEGSLSFVIKPGSYMWPEEVVTLRDA